MFSLGPRSVRLRTQIVLLQVAVVGLTLGLAFGVFAYVSGQRLSGEYGERALAIARTVASDPVVRTEVARYSNSALPTGPQLEDELADGELAHIADDARLRTGALFVVITDDAGLRLAHPDRTRLGEMVSTDPSKALAGGEVVIREHGTLGESVRAKVPVLERGTGRVVGEVSVGISTTAVREQLLRDLRRAGLLIGGALLAGIAGSVLLARRWHGLTLGLEPSELAELVREQDAVLHGIGEGVVAADAAWRVTVINDEARRLLGITAAPGADIDAIGLTPRVLQAFRSADGQPVQAAVGERIVVVTARAVTRDGRPLGAVLSVRDRTDVESLTRQLDAVRSMSTVLRAQRHEFANRLHLLSGLLHTGRSGEAANYLDELLGSGPLGAALPGIDAVADPYLQAFLSAKAAHAREKGVHLRLGPNTWVTANLAAPVDVTTVLGNLLDNAIDAAAERLVADGGAQSAAVGGPVRASVDAVITERGHEPGDDPDISPVVEVELVQEGDTLHIAVADSGAGVTAELVDSIFVEGVSTRSGGDVPGGRGVGLALSRQVARARGGEVRLAHPGGVAASTGESGAGESAESERPLRGAEFIARLPGVLIEGEPAWAAEN
ncbi:ATP-binding protein [Nocardia sp. NPDC056100]|uniref:ATP-binding protein n=1 Tax=Nocardia sp. NPDC056100 TaxID=3345712 RepID=UPI0035DB096B